ncbi:MAG: lipoyl(octanoyl) transferase LipB [Rikenellaceae bacterium]
MQSSISLIDKGVIEYKEAWDFQKEIFATLSALDYKGDDFLIYCEHPHVYTLGKSGHFNNLLVDEAFLKTINATFFKTDRGGDITYHGYGQLVGYPILRLQNYDLSLKGYIDLIEQAVINTVSAFGIDSFRVEGKTGVWVNTQSMEKKICAIGVKASRYITMHGFALNVNTDLDYFNYINPCGFCDKGVTSLKQLLGKEVDFQRVKELYFSEFSALLMRK